MTIDERIKALVGRHGAMDMNLELMGRDLETMRAKAERDGANISKILGTAEGDGENIRALARIADMRDRRLTSLEGAAS